MNKAKEFNFEVWRAETENIINQLNVMLKRAQVMVTVDVRQRRIRHDYPDGKWHETSELTLHSERMAD